MYLVLSTALFFCTSHLALAAVYPHGTVPVRKPVRLGIRDLPDASSRYVKPEIANEEMQDPSNEPTNLGRTLERQPDSHEHSFMMITASSGGSRGTLGGGQEADDAVSFEMLIVDFIETDGNQDQAQKTPVPTIEAVKTVKRILPPPTFSPTLRSQLITDETRAKADRLKLFAGRSASVNSGPFIKFAESFGAAMATKAAEASKTVQAAPTEPSEPEYTGLPAVVQKAPQPQNTFILSEEKTIENFNNSHHSQL